MERPGRRLGIAEVPGGGRRDGTHEGEVPSRALRTAVRTRVVSYRKRASGARWSVDERDGVPAFTAETVGVSVARVTSARKAVRRVDKIRRRRDGVPKNIQQGGL